jgi:hypothetical protein
MSVTADRDDVPTIELDWTPHAGQRDVLASEARFKIIACGRRWGKTDLAAKWLARQALAPDTELCWWVGPGYEVVDPGWRAVCDTLPEAVIEDRKLSKPYQVDLVNGTTIAFRTTTSDSNVGVGLDALVIDEAAQVSKQRWQRDLRPTLSDTLGEMMAISTPRGRNWFHDWYQRGQSTDTEYDDVDSWSAPTTDNPHVPDAEVDAAEKELPERVYRQEYRAEFIDDAGGVFEQVRERIVADYDHREVDGTAPYTIGVDFARHQDYTVIVVLDGEDRLVDFERLRDTTWPAIQSAIETLAERYGGRAVVDATRDNKIIADLEAAGVDVDPVTFSPRKKRDLIENLITAVESETLTVPDIPPLITELQLYEYDTTRAGNVRYHAPDGHHDDCVDALALAVDGSRGRDDGDVMAFQL